MPRTEHAWITLLKTVIFTVVVPASVTIWIPRWLLRTNAPVVETVPPLLPYLGGVPIVAGAVIYLWCAWDFTFAGKGTPAPIDAPRNLVAHGLYRYVRNPMYVGVLSILFGEALWFWSKSLAQYGLIVLAFFYMFVILFEEPVLRAKFGDSYRKYCEMVPRWIPRRPGGSAL